MAKKHVIVMAFPFGSHAAPLLDLIGSLAVAAPEVKFSFLSTSTSNKSLFHFSHDDNYHNVKPYDVDDGMPHDFVISGNPQQLVDVFLKASPGNFKAAMDQAVRDTGREISCLITDAFLWFGADLAQEFHIPWLPLWTAAPQSLLVHVLTDRIRQNLLHTTGHDEKQIVEITPDYSLQAADLPEGIISGDLESCFAMMLLKMGRNLHRAKAVAINSFEEIHPKVVGELRTRFQSFLNVGPFSLKCPPRWTRDEHGVLEWLDQHGYASVAYISFGRVITPPPHELQALAEALEECKVPFLWSFRGNLEDKLPKGFLQKVGSRGKIVPWTAQLLVLAHPSVGVFVTHGGWNSVLESIIAGVPMICRPFFGDQKINMRTIESVWGFGMGLQGGVFTKHGAKQALELSLLRKQGWSMRERLKELKENAYKSVGPDGTSTRDFHALLDIITK